MASAETISVYLLKTSIGSPSDPLRSESTYTTHVVPEAGPEATLFVKATENSVPDWVRLLGPYTDPEIAETNRSPGALLVLKGSQRWFAIAFGQGRHLIDPSSYERGFGRRVSLNTADPNHLRGAQARTFNDSALHTSRQLSRPAGVSEFEFDFDRDLLTSISGRIHDDNLGRRIDGRDAARLTADIDVAALASKCDALLAASERTDYRARFPQVDTIQEIRDPTVVDSLHQQMLADLAASAFDRFDLFPPELVADEIVRYRIYPSEGGLVVLEPDQTLLRFVLRRYASDLERGLRRYTLTGLDAAGHDVDQWSFLDCLHYEVSDTDGLAVLDGGQWYRVERSLVKQVESFANGLQPSGLSLPAALRGETEPAYNARVAQNDAFALLDGQLARLDGQSGVEPCDLLSKEGHFIHVKRRKGGSGPLSHLFNQAIVSAQCLRGEPSYCGLVRDLLSGEPPAFAELLPDRPDVRDLPIVLALITKNQKRGYPAKDLPFFSKVSLRLAVRHLQNMGFDVYVDDIPTPLLGTR